MKFDRNRIGDIVICNVKIISLLKANACKRYLTFVITCTIIYAYHGAGMKIEFTKQAAKYFEKAPESLQRRLEKAIENILIGSGDIQPLVGEENFFRLRVGGYRIVFYVDVLKDAVVIIRIGPRGDVYKK